MKKQSEYCRIHYYESSDSEEDTDDEDDEDDRQPMENSFVLQFIGCMLFVPKAKFRKWKHARAIKKQIKKDKELIEELIKGDTYHWMSPEIRSEYIATAVRAGFLREDNVYTGDWMNPEQRRENLRHYRGDY